MKNFSADFLVEIRSALGTDGYHPDDFELEQATNTDFQILTIRYRPHPDFYFKIQIRTREKTVAETLGRFRHTVEDIGEIHVFVCPGEMLHVEHAKPDLKNDVLSSLSRWVMRMDRELTAMPLNRKIGEQRRQLEVLAEQVGEITEGYYSNEEAEELKARLDALEVRMSEQIRQSTDDKAEITQKLTALHAEIELLKRQVTQLDKRGWTKSMLVRVANWLRDPTNRQLLESGTDLAKSILLPPGGGGKGD